MIEDLIANKFFRQSKKSQNLKKNDAFDSEKNESLACQFLSLGNRC